jgi:hypothetical protein
MQNLKIKVIETNSQEIMKEFELDQSEQAYHYAEEMEQLGLDVIVKKPTITQTLAHNLGADEQKLSELAAELEHEIDEHQSIEGCCAKKALH